MKKSILNRRHRLMLIYGTATISIILLAALLLWALTPSVDEYRPGDSVEGLTETLSRDIPADYPQVFYRDVTRESGITFRHFWKERSTQLPEDMGSGAAWGDYDLDGDLDLYLCNISGPLTASSEEIAGSPASNRLYRNQGDGTFEDVTKSSGLEFRAVSMGASWGDYDGDGRPDLLVTNYGRNRLFRNGQDGFHEVSEDVGLGEHQGFWAGASWGDYDRDGDLDLYVCGYVEFDYDPQDLKKSTSQYQAVVPFTINPSSYSPQANLLFENVEGRFHERAAEAGVANGEGRSLTAAWCDLNGDQWLDLYVANDISDNVLYRNRGDGSFEDVSHEAWVADYRGAMGLALGDWDNDLDIDMFVTHWIAQENALYDNVRRFMDDPTDGPTEESLHFFDIADQVGLGQIALSYIGWGTSFLDYDNDGRLDLFVVNGSTFQEEQDPTRLVPMRDLLFWNRGPEAGFYEVGEALGEVFTEPRVGRGAAFADYDDDGDMDALVVNHDGPPVLLRNEGGNRNRWLKVRVRGKGHNVTGLGARVEIATKGGNQVRVIGSQPSYLSQNAQEAHFGLGRDREIDRLVVRFPCGNEVELRDVASNQTIEVVEGE